MFWSGLRALGTISFVVVCITISVTAIAMLGMFAMFIIKILVY